MRHEILESLNDTELGAYAKAIGIDVSKAKTKKAKIAAIESVRERVADVTAMGLTFHVPIKRLHDLNVTARLGGGVESDAELAAIVDDILGEEQTKALYERCTDDDGVLDGDAVSVALALIVSSPELKNF